MFRPDTSTAWPRVSVVVPTLNEARNLPHVFARLPADVYEVIVVDGHSVDGTLEVARQLRPDVRVVMQTRKGKGNALACGFEAATGDVIAMVDADGSADPGEIPRFVKALTEGADFAKGTRFTDGAGSGDITWLRRMGNRVLSGVIDHCPGLLHCARRDLMGVTVVPNSFGKGLSGGRNTGALAASGDVIAFLDDDAAADPGWIAAISDCYRDPRVLGPAAWSSPPGTTGGPPGSRQSSTGWLAAATGARRRSVRRCGISSAPTCPSAGRFLTGWAGSRPVWAGWALFRSAARRPNCACGPAAGPAIHCMGTRQRDGRP